MPICGSQRVVVESQMEVRQHDCETPVEASSGIAPLEAKQPSNTVLPSGVEPPPFEVKMPSEIVVAAASVVVAGGESLEIELPSLVIPARQSMSAQDRCLKAPSRWMLHSPTVVQWQYARAIHQGEIHHG